MTVRWAILAAALLAVLVGAAKAAERPRQATHWYLVPLERIIGAKPACRYMQCWETGARYR